MLWRAGVPQRHRDRFRRRFGHFEITSQADAIHNSCRACAGGRRRANSRAWARGIKAKEESSAT